MTYSIQDGVRKLTCDGLWPGCDLKVTHIDEKGYTYCKPCGISRKQYMRCRQLKPKELKQLESGQPLQSYSRSGT